MKLNILGAAFSKSAQIITVFILSGTVCADSYVYTYTGNNYNNVYSNQSYNIFDTTMYMELSFTTDSLLTNFAGDAAAFVTSFSISDGVNTLTEADNLSISAFDIVTDSLGNISQWDIRQYEGGVLGLGDRHSIMVTRYIVGGLEEDKAVANDCIAAPFGTCSTLETFNAEVIGTRGSWSVVSIPSTLIGILPATPGGTDYQAYYDQQLDITWTADANINGLDNWYNQTAWAASLTIGNVSGWRLPNVNKDNDSIIVNCSSSTQAACMDNEFGHLYWYGGGTTLGGGITHQNPGVFSNVRLLPAYFTSNERPDASVYIFNFGNGMTGADYKADNHPAWAVHDGDARLFIDSDSDGLPDVVEDSNGNGIVDPGETDPLDNDSDDDGALDGQEDTNANGVVDPGEADPLNFDTDGDGLTDGYEINVVGTDPSTSTMVYTLPGDMNGDGEVNLGDLLLLQRELLGY